MKILFIHEVNYETKVIFEIQEFPELLALRGHEIDFLQFPENSGFKNRNFRTNFKTINGRVYEDAKIRLITPTNLGGSFIDRLISTLTVIPTLWKLIKRSKYDAVVLYSVPTSGWQAALIAKIRKVPLVFRALDVSHLLRHGLSEKLILKAEKIVYQNSSLLSVNNQALGNYCESLIGKKLQLSVDVPPLDFSHFDSSPVSQGPRQKYGIGEDDLVFMFMGTFYEFSGISNVIKSLHASQDRKVKIVLVGGGKQEVELQDLVQNLSIERQVIFTGLVPYSQLPEILGMANVAFNSFEPALISNVAFPHKVLQYLASGIPTVSTKLDGLYSALGDNSGVVWVETPDEIYDAAIKISSISQDEIIMIKQQGRNFIESHFNKKIATDKFEKTILRATSIGQSG